MKNADFVLVAAACLLAACSAARDERMQNATGGREPVQHNTIVSCPVYDGMTKKAEVLAQVIAGSEVQITDTINADFVRVRLDEDGRTLTGYMDRRCFAEQGRK